MTSKIGIFLAPPLKTISAKLGEVASPFDYIPDSNEAPWKGYSGASYSRFVLPFRYNVKPCSAPPDAEGRYQGIATDVDAAWASRRRYLMEDTAGALFKRAKWFQWNASGTTSAPDVAKYFVLASGRKVVRIRPSKIILFECSDDALAGSIGSRSNDSVAEFRTGFLIVDCYFPQVNSGGQEQCFSFDDLLQFNEHFRYWRRPFREHGCKMRVFLDGANTADLDDSNEMYSLYQGRWIELLKGVFETVGNDGKSRKFRLDIAFDDAKRWWVAEMSAATCDDKARSPFTVQMDDRAFCWTCAVTPGGSKAFNTLDHAASDKHMESLALPSEWIRLLQVDSSLYKASQFERNWAGERTYRRWEHFGSLYGFNYYSAAMVTGPIAEPPTWRHFQNQYFDLQLLLLYLRISIFRFSEKLSEISAKRLDHLHQGVALNYEAQARREFQALREAFTLMTNMYQFPLASNQQQGLEMYATMRKQMDVEELFREIRQEIDSTHEQFELNLTSQVQTRTEQIAKYGLPIAVGALAASTLALQNWKPTSLIYKSLTGGAQSERTEAEVNAAPVVVDSTLCLPDFAKLLSFELGSAELILLVLTCVGISWVVFPRVFRRVKAQRG